MSRPSCHVQTCDRQTSAGLCPIHRRALLDALAAVRDLVDELQTQLTRQARYSTTSTRAGSTTPLAFDTTASTQIRRLTSTLARWDGLVADRLGHPVRHPRPTDAAAYIRAAIRAGRLNTWPRTAQLLADLTHQQQTVAKTIDHPTDPLPSGICGNTPHGQTTPCGAQLYTDDQHDIVPCPACGAIYSVTDMRTTLLDAADDTLMTAAEAAAALLARTEHTRRDETRLTDRIRNNARITHRSTDTRDGRERKLYRFGDIRTHITLET